MDTKRAYLPASGKPAPLPAAPDKAPPAPSTAPRDEIAVVGPSLLRGFLGSGN